MLPLPDKDILQVTVERGAQSGEGVQIYMTSRA